MVIVFSSVRANMAGASRNRKPHKTQVSRPAEINDAFL